MVLRGDSAWTFRVRVCRCSFEEVVLSASLPKQAADEAVAMSRADRTLRYITAPVTHSVEVFFDGQWVPLDKVDFT